MENEDIIIEEEIIPDVIKKLREELKKCNLEKQEYLAGWQRAKADFINARKEEEENRHEFIKFAEKTLVFELLAVVDSFDRLFLNKELWEKVGQDTRTGIENIYSQFMNILKNRGVETIEGAGEKFDPREHESVTEEKVDNQEKENIIIDVIRKGYKLNGAVIRPAQVKVGKYV